MIDIDSKDLAYDVVEICGKHFTTRPVEDCMGGASSQGTFDKKSAREEVVAFLKSIGGWNDGD